LRKTLSYFLGMFIAFTLGYVFLDPSFLQIADWLGPLFGTPLLTALTVVFLLFGDPLKFAVLSVLWGGVAFLGGFVIRRRAGAVATMISVYLFFLPILAASAYDIFQTVSALGVMGGQQNPFDMLPPFPRGMSLTHLIEAPVIGKIVEVALDMMESGGFQGGQSVAMTLVTPILTDFAEKMVLVCFAALVGAEVGRRLEGRFRPWSEALRLRLGGRPVPGLTAPETPAKALTLLILLVLSAGFLVPLGSGAPEDGYYENLVGLVDDRGRAYVGAVFLDSSTPFGGLGGDIPEEGLLAAAMVSQDSILDALPEIDEIPSEVDISSYLSLVPSTTLVIVYVDIPPDAASERAEAVSRMFEDAFGVRFKLLLAVSPPVQGEGGEGPPRFTVVAYESTALLSDLADAYVDLYSGRSGLAQTVVEAHESGRLIPGGSPESADGSAMFTGFVNLKSLGGFVPLEELDRMNITGLVLPSFDAPIGFHGFVSYWSRGVHSPPDAHSLDLLGLLGVEGTVRFSPDALLSNLILIAPNQTLGGGPEGGRTIKVVTTAHLTDPYLAGMFEEDGQRVSLTVVERGSILDPSHFGITFSALLPLDVRVSREITELGGTRREVQVTVTVTNEDDYPMESVELDDGGAVLSYTGAVVSGSTAGSWSVLQPGESGTLTYTLRLESGGVYTLRPAAVGYAYGGETFTASSDIAEAEVPHPTALAFVAVSLGASWAASAEALDTFTGGNGSTVLMASTLAWVAVLAFVEYRGFKKWLAGG